MLVFFHVIFCSFRSSLSWVYMGLRSLQVLIEKSHQILTDHIVAWNP
jgi:hypothetical protein